MQYVKEKVLNPEVGKRFFFFFFSKASHESNIPQEVIGNSSRWKWMQKSQDTSDGEESDRFFYAPKSVKKVLEKGWKK